MKFSRTFDLLDFDQQHSWPEGFMHRFDEQIRETYSNDQNKSRFLRFASFLNERNIGRGQKVILIPEAASRDWLLLDLAVQSLQAVVVMVHATTAEPQLKTIIAETKAKLVIGLNAKLQVVSDQSAQNFTLSQVIDSGVEPMSLEKIRELQNSVNDQELSSIIYTSGTTGEPKGVMLSHANIMSNVQAITLLMPLVKQDRILTYLPYSHVFERTMLYSYLAHKANIYFIGTPQNLAAALREVKPQFFTAVPRVLERMYNQVVQHFSSRKWLGRRSLKWAIKVSEKYKPHRFSPLTALQIFFIRNLLLRGWCKQMGGELKAILVGAAHLRPSVAQAFLAAGINVREGYGMTETSPVVTVNRFEPGLHRVGTVGLPLPGVKLRIKNPNETGEGEIEVQGPNVMMGYFGREEETRRILSEDGWLSTGDVGKKGPHGFLVITDRSKDIFKTSTGKYIAPQELENYFRDSPLIEDLLVVGFQRPFVTALVLPNFAMLEYWALQANVHWTSPQYMVLNIKILERMQEEVDRLNELLPNYKKLRSFHLLPKAFSIEKGQLSNTLKPIRKTIVSDYAKEIQKMYVK